MSRYLHLLIVFLAALSLAPFSAAQPYQAQCVFTPTSDGKALNIRGRLTFTAQDSPSSVKVGAQITGTLGTNPYAIGINEFGDLTDQATGLSTGQRFKGSGNPAGHGCPPSPDRYAGDLGNWNAVSGVIEASQDINLLTLADPLSSIVGLSAVLYQKADNCSDPAGTQSNRLAVCVIGITNADNNPASNLNPAYQGAVAVLQPTINCNASCSGTVWFTATPQGVQIVASVSGLKDKHGFHIHQYGDLSSTDGTSAGAHWNPNGRNHALPGTTPRHIGDLGNIQSFDKSSGLGWYNYTEPYIPNVYSLLGRTVVIHSQQDHGAGAGCDQAGTAGKRVMIGVIGVINSAGVPATVPIPVNNTYQDVPCVANTPSPSAKPKGKEEDTSGLKAGLAIGWIVVGVLSLFVIPGMIVYYWYKIKPTNGHTGGMNSPFDYHRV